MQNYFLNITGLPYFIHFIKNFFSNKFFDVIYVSDSSTWVISKIGKNTTDYLNKKKLCKTYLTNFADGFRNKIVHFGSLHVLKKFSYKNCKIILTWYHFEKKDPASFFIKNNQNKINKIHTASNIVGKQLIDFGIAKEKIKIVPLGIDLKLYKPISESKKRLIKYKNNIPLDASLIGSFQKDGNGWGEGLTPKLIKGPDIFVKTVSALAKKHNICVILTGPARGYIKEELLRNKIPFRHFYNNSHEDIIPYIQICDMCLITSRNEGGPMQLLEAMACGVSVVSTKVGMAPDIISDQFNGFLCNISKTKELIEKSSKLLKNKKLRNKFRKNSLNKIKNYSLEKIIEQQYSKLYEEYLT